VKDFLSRFLTIPDLLELDHLTVSGDVTFGRNVSLRVSYCDRSNYFPMRIKITKNAVSLESEILLKSNECLNMAALPLIRWGKDVTGIYFRATIVSKRMMLRST